MPLTKPYIEPDWPAPPGLFALCTTRCGGYSEPPYDGLNLALHVDDNAAHVERNRAVVDGWLPSGARVQWLDQVHGSKVVEANPHAAAIPRADACWSREQGVACAVLTADCLPVLFCTRDGSRVAAAHAGWRGLLEGVLAATVSAMEAAPDRILAWLGPAIGPGAFEVGGEVRAAFLDGAAARDASHIAACFVPNPANPGHYFGDLYALARLSLRLSGIDAVFGGGLCTFSDPAHFYSYRRDGCTGRMASLVVIGDTPGTHLPA